MKDSYGRTIDYMRISITDRCNLRCRYCMPEGILPVPMSALLTFEELTRVCEQAAKLGIRKIKITGGEPLVRRGTPQLLGMLSSVPGMEEVTLTTNGVLLEKFLPDLVKNGLRNVNISLDTMDRKKYREITGTDAFTTVLHGMEAAVKAGLKVKMNTVLMKEYNQQEWKTLVEYTRNHPVDVRFIELMPIGTGNQFQGVSNQWVKKMLEKEYPALEKEETPRGNGPATYYRIPGFCGCIGLISALHGKFCAHCNRIRMSAQGEIKPCLCYKSTVDLREIIRNPHMTEKEQNLKISMVLARTIAEKPQAHCFENPEKITEGKKMSSIGG